MSMAVRSLALVPPAAPARCVARRGTAPAAHLADLTPEAREVLARLRLAALACRASARLDVFETCARLANGDAASAGAAEALVRALPEALGARPVLFRPGVETLSFDEAWLVAVIAALTGSRNDDLAFLLASRVVRPMRRQIAFLAATVARAAEPVKRASI